MLKVLRLTLIFTFFKCSQRFSPNLLKCPYFFWNIQIHVLFNRKLCKLNQYEFFYFLAVSIISYFFKIYFKKKQTQLNFKWRNMKYFLILFSKTINPLQYKLLWHCFLCTSYWDDLFWQSWTRTQILCVPCRL